MKRLLLVASLFALAACGGNSMAPSSIATTPSGPSVWTITKSNALPAPLTVNGGNIVVATATFQYPPDRYQTINGIPAFCYPLNETQTEAHGKYYISESDSNNQYNTTNLVGAGTIDDPNDRVCFAGSTTVYHPQNGSYTLTLYFVPKH